MNISSKRTNILKTLLALFLIFTLFAVGSTVSKYQLPEQSVQTMSKLGSKGEEVKKIQTKLKDWGYYKGSVDGVYGSKTRQAVIDFQKKNGLTADGVAGTKTLSAIGISSSSKSNSQSNSGGYGGMSQNDYNLLARVISAEARGEPYNGQVAVGAVILNRVEHPSFPNTISGVVYQPDAFTCMKDGQFNQPVQESCYNAARDAINGMDPSNGCIYYYNPQTAKSAWIWSRPILLKIGKHNFCTQ